MKYFISSLAILAVLASLWLAGNPEISVLASEASRDPVVGKQSPTFKLNENASCYLHHGFRFKGGFGPEQATITQISFVSPWQSGSRIADGYDNQDIYWSRRCDHVRLNWIGGESPWSESGQSCWGGDGVPFPGSDACFVGYTDLCEIKSRQVFIRLPGVATDWPYLGLIFIDLLDKRDRLNKAVSTLKWKNDFTLELTKSYPGKPETTKQVQTEPVYMIRARLSSQKQKNYTMNFYRLIVEYPDFRNKNQSYMGPAVDWLNQNGVPYYNAAKKEYEVQVFFTKDNAADEIISKVKVGLYRYNWMNCDADGGVLNLYNRCAVSPLTQVSIDPVRRISDVRYQADPFLAPAFLNYKRVLSGFTQDDAPKVVVRAKNLADGTVKVTTAERYDGVLNLTSMEGSSYDIQVTAVYRGIEYGIGSPVFPKIERKGTKPMLGETQRIGDTEFTEANPFWSSYTVGERLSTKAGVTNLQFDAYPFFEVHLKKPQLMRYRATVSLNAQGVPAGLRSVSLVRRFDGKLIPLSVSGSSASGEIEGVPGEEYAVQFVISVDSRPGATAELTQDKTTVPGGNNQSIKVVSMRSGGAEAQPGTAGWNSFTIRPDGRGVFTLSVSRILSGFDQIRRNQPRLR